MELEGAGKLSFRIGHRVIPPGRERLALDTPLGTPLQTQSLQPGCEQIGPLLFVGQGANLDVFVERAAVADILDTDKATTQSVLQGIILAHVGVVDEDSIQRHTEHRPIAQHRALIPLPRRTTGKGKRRGRVVNSSRRPQTIRLLVVSQVNLEANF